MIWLSQNWVFLVAIAGAIFLMSRGGGCCGGHHHSAKKDGLNSSTGRGSTHS